MITVEEAKKIILSHTENKKESMVDLSDAYGLFLSRDIQASFPMPRFNNSAMDGYAVHSEDLKKATQDNPVILSCQDDIPAGKEERLELCPGRCMKIMTGAPLPGGADTVIMQEVVTIKDKKVSFNRCYQKGTNVRFQGEDVKQGQVLLKKGNRCGFGQIAMLAAFGFEEVPVISRVKVSVLSTGSELVELGQPLGWSQIYDSNSSMLNVMLKKENCDVISLGISKDNRESLKEKMKQGLESDVLLISGGVSVGEHDLVKDVLNELGVEEIFWKIKMKPGKPVFFGKGEKCYVFGLPGNPASSFVAFHEFAKPAIRKMMGSDQVENRMIKAKLETSLKRGTSRKQYLRARAELSKVGWSVSPMSNQGSHALSSLSGANALIVLDEMCEASQKGDLADVKIIEPF